MLHAPLAALRCADEWHHRAIGPGGRMRGFEVEATVRRRLDLGRAVVPQ